MMPYSLKIKVRGVKRQDRDHTILSWLKELEALLPWFRGHCCKSTLSPTFKAGFWNDKGSRLWGGSDKPQIIFRCQTTYGFNTKAAGGDVVMHVDSCSKATGRSQQSKASSSSWGVCWGSNVCVLTSLGRAVLISPQLTCVFQVYQHSFLASYLIYNLYTRWEKNQNQNRI